MTGRDLLAQPVLGWPVLPPLQRVRGMSADDFFRLVAVHYRVWAAVRAHPSAAAEVAGPSAMMAARAGEKPATVQYWIWQAQQRGFLPPVLRGKAAW